MEIFCVSNIIDSISNNNKLWQQIHQKLSKNAKSSRGLLTGKNVEPSETAGHNTKHAAQVKIFDASGITYGCVYRN